MDEDHVFSRAFRTTHAAVLTRVVMVLVVGVPAAVALFLPRVLTPAPWGWGVVGVGLLAFNWTLLNYLMPFNFTVLRKNFEYKARQEKIPLEAGQAFFVGLSPGRQPKVYEGFMEWDMGWLLLSPTHLCYAGDRTRFSLPRERVSAVDVVPGHPGWYGSRSIAVTVDGEWDFNLVTTDIHSMLEQSASTRALGSLLQTWRGGRASFPVLPERLLDLPQAAHFEALGKAPASPLLGSVVTALLFGFLAMGLTQLQWLSGKPPDTHAAAVALTLSVVLTAWTLLPNTLYGLKHPGND